MQQNHNSHNGPGAKLLQIKLLSKQNKALQICKTSREVTGNISPRNMFQKMTIGHKRTLLGYLILQMMVNPNFLNDFLNLTKCISCHNPSYFVTLLSPHFSKTIHLPNWIWITFQTFCSVDFTPWLMSLCKETIFFNIFGIFRFLLRP